MDFGTRTHMDSDCFDFTRLDTRLCFSCSCTLCFSLLLYSTMASYHRIVFAFCFAFHINTIP